MKLNKVAKSIISSTLALAIGISLSACTSAQNGSNTHFLLATGGTSGTYYPLGGAITNVINENVDDMNVTIQATGASKENIRLLANFDADYAIVQNDIMDYAANGKQLFEGKPIEGVSSVAAIYPEVIQIIVSADSGINSVADLKGKRISTGDAGSGVEANALQVLSAYGLSSNDIIASHLSFKESGNAFKDGQLDGFFVTAGVPNTAVTELALTRPLKMISVDGAEAQALMEEYPFYSSIVVPKEVYKTQEDVTTVAVKAMIACSANLSEDAVYNFTKAMYENVDSIALAHAKGKEIKLEEAVEGLTVDLHPGAAKYFREKGIIE